MESTNVFKDLDDENKKNYQVWLRIKLALRNY